MFRNTANSVAAYVKNSYNELVSLRAFFLLSGVLLVVANPSHAAFTSASSSVAYDDEPGRASLQVVNGPVGTAGSPSAASFTSSITPGLASEGFGDVAFGALHASAAAFSFGEFAQTRGAGGALWADQVTYTSSTLSGAAVARASFSLSGGLFSISDANDVGAAGNSTIAAVVTVGGTQVFSTTGQLISRNGVITTNDIRVNGVNVSGPSNSLTGVFFFDIPFVFNTPFQLRATLDAFVQAQTTAAGDQASATSNFGSSGLWGGISEVHRADGTVLTGYSLTSDSAYDWSKAYAAPVPEPASSVLFTIALVGLAAVIRRRNSV